MKPHVAPDANNDVPGLRQVTRVRPLEEELDAVAWRTLFHSDAGSRAVQHPDYAVRSARLRDKSLWLWESDSLVSRSGLLAMGLLEERPFFIRPIPALRFLKCQLRVLRLVGSRLMGDHDELTAEQFLHGLQSFLHSKDRQGIDAIYLEEINFDSSVGRAIAAAPRSISRNLIEWNQRQPHWTVKFPRQRADYWGKFSSKTKQTFRRKQRACSGRVSVIKNESDVPRFVEAAEFISQRSWQGRKLGLRIRNQPSAVEDMQSLARLGLLRSYLLWREDEPVAFIHGNRWNGCFLLDETAYDPAFHQLSPGTVLLLEAIEDLLNDETIHAIDFGFGHAPYKELFGTDVGQMASWLFLGDRYAAKLMSGLRNQYVWGSTVLRNVAGKWGVKRTRPK